MATQVIDVPFPLHQQAVALYMRDPGHCASSDDSLCEDNDKQLAERHRRHLALLLTLESEHIQTALDKGLPELALEGLRRAVQLPAVVSRDESLLCAHRNALQRLRAACERPSSASGPDEAPTPAAELIAAPFRRVNWMYWDVLSKRIVVQLRVYQFSLVDLKEDVKSGHSARASASPLQERAYASLETLLQLLEEQQRVLDDLCRGCADDALCAGFLEGARLEVLRLYKDLCFTYALRFADVRTQGSLLERALLAQKLGLINQLTSLPAGDARICDAYVHLLRLLQELVLHCEDVGDTRLKLHYLLELQETLNLLPDPRAAPGGLRREHLLQPHFAEITFYRLECQFQAVALACWSAETQLVFLKMLQSYRDDLQLLCTERCDAPGPLLKTRRLLRFYERRSALSAPPSSGYKCAFVLQNARELGLLRTQRPGALDASTMQALQTPLWTLWLEALERGSEPPPPGSHALPAVGCVADLAQLLEFAQTAAHACVQEFCVLLVLRDGARLEEAAQRLRHLPPSVYAGRYDGCAFQGVGAALVLTTRSAMRRDLLHGRRPRFGLAQVAGALFEAQDAADERELLSLRAELLERVRLETGVLVVRVDAASEQTTLQQQQQQQGAPLVWAEERAQDGRWSAVASLDGCGALSDRDDETLSEYASSRSCAGSDSDGHGCREEHDIERYLV